MRLFVATVFWVLMLKEIKNHMKFLDLFAGIGGFRLGMESAGHECVGFCEIDKFARKSYKAIHDTKGEIELHDITAVSDESIRRIGHLRGECTRRVFPLSKSGQQVASIKEQYSNTITTRYGNSQGAGAYIVESKSQKVRSIGNIHPSGNGILIAGKLPVNHDQNSRVYDTNGLAPTLSTMQGGGQEPKIIQRGHGYNQGGEHDIAPTLTSNSYQENNLVKVVDFYNKITKDEVGTLTSSGGGSTVRAGSFGITDGYRIRKLTPRECWRLQGFPDWAFDKAQKVNSNSQLYKQAGNSVTVSVIAAIAKELE